MNYVIDLDDIWVYESSALLCFPDGIRLAVRTAEALS
jgi:hypothetical protein